MLVDLKNVWEQQGDQLYVSCARAIIGFAERADAELKPAELAEFLAAAGSALTEVGGGEEPDEVELAFEANGLSRDLSDLICDLASLTDFGVQQIGRLFSLISSDAALKRRDTALLALNIKNLDLRSYEEPESDSHAEAVAGMRAIRSGLEALDHSALGEATNSVRAINPFEATDDVVSAASVRLFGEMRSAVSASVEAVKATGARIELVSADQGHHYNLDVKGCIPLQYHVGDFLGEYGSDIHRLLEKLDMLHALCGSDESIAQFARDCASVGQFLPGSKDGTLAAHLKKGRDGFAAFVAWYDAQPGTEHRCSVIKEKVREMCDHWGLTGKSFLGISAEQWIQAKRGATKVKRKGLMVMVRGEAEAASAVSV